MSPTMLLRRFLRPVSLFCVSVLVASTSASGVNTIGSDLFEALRGLQWSHPGEYTDSPGRAFLGPHPGRAPHTRGGMWVPGMFNEAAHGASPFEASIGSAALGGGLHTLAVSADPGGPLPWEGSLMPQGGAGQINTANGNKLTSIPLVSWKARGGMTVDFTLFHNSETNYSDELGAGWTWTYDIYINNLTGNPVVHWGNGLSIPFTSSGTGGTSGGGGGGLEPHGPLASSELTPTYTAPAGIYDQLVQNSDTTWTITKQNGTKYQFNTAGFCNAIQDRNGNQITLTLNSSNYCTKVTDPTGRYITISVSGSNKFTGVTDPAGNAWTFTINGSGDLSTVSWPVMSGSTYTDQFAYSTHWMTSHTDRRGKVWAATYNSTDGSVASETDPLSHSRSFSYASSATTITDPLSHTHVDNYSSGILSSSQDESSYSDSYTARDSNYNVTSFTDKRGKVWAQTWDLKGNRLTFTDPLSHVKNWTYNSFSEPLTYTDGLSHVVATNTYDTHGNLLTVTNALSKVIATNTYDSYGELSTVKNALNKTTSFGYATNGDLATVTDPLTHETFFYYDTLGRLTSKTDPLSHTESVAYDVWERPVTYTHPGSSTRALVYNACGSKTSETDELSHTKNWVFDDAGRLTSVTNPKSEAESYSYDNANHLTSVTNGRSYTRTYTVTNRGEVSSLTMPDSAYEEWSHDGNGNTTAYTNPLTQTISYTFDDAGRETGITYPTGTNPAFSYDAADRRTSMVDSTGTTSWTFDNGDRVTALSTPQGNLSFGYDDSNRRTSMVDSTGTTSYTLDDANRLTGLTNPQSEATSFSYDNANNRTQVTYSSGAYTVYGFDSRNRCTSSTTKNSSATTLNSESYTWDDAGNQTAKTVNSVSTSYGYDLADQLASETSGTYSASYTYDANGNRSGSTIGGVTSVYNVDNGDKLTSITVGGTAVKSYTYDAAGRTHTVVTSAGTTTLSYDYEDRVTGITYPSSATNSFTYNALATRVGKVDSGGTKTYRRDGVGVTDPVISDGSSTYTPGVSMHTGTATTFQHADYLGSYDIQTNVSQGVTATQVYDAWGNLRSSTGTIAGPFAFVGNEGYQFDSDSGLMLIGHRYYDASTGRFLTRDHAKDGRNWFIYCSASPASNFDPTGEETFAGDTHGYPALAWIGPGNWGSHNGLPKKTVMHIIMETDDDSIGIWGHGAKGKIYINPTEYLEPKDIDQIADWRHRHHKPKFNYFMVNECDVMADGAMINSLLQTSNSVQGYRGTCVGISALRDNWTKPFH